MVSSWQSNDWIGTTEDPRLTDSASPQSERSSNATAIQEPDIRPPTRGQPPQVSPNPAFPQKYASLPASPLDQNTGHKDTPTRTDPSPHDRFLLFPPATLTEQASLPKLPIGNTTNSAASISSRHPAQPTPHRPSSLDTSSQQNTSPPPDHFAQSLWDNDPATPGAVLFSTGPIMPKPPSGQPPDTNPGRRSSVDRGLWVAPSGVPSSNASSDPGPPQDRDVVHPPGYQPDAPSLVYTTIHPTNAGSHTGYPVGYPSYPGSTPFGPSSPRHPSFGGPPSTSPHVQGSTYPNAGSGPVYPNYRPGMPYSPYTPYQSGSGFSQYPASPPGFGPMPGNFPNNYSASPAASGYPTSPSASNYQGSSVGGGYSSPTGAYAIHFSPYGMVSAPPMYAPATYAHAPYGHPYLPPQGHADDGSTSGMWWFMPAGSGSGANTTQLAGAYGTQPQTQAQFLQRFGGLQQPLQPISTMLNASSPHPQQFPPQTGFPPPPPPLAHSPTTAMSPMVTGSTPSAASPRQMYASFSAMSLQSPQPPAGRQPPPLTLPAPPISNAPHSAGIQSPVRPTSTSKGRASAASKTGPGGSRVTSPATRRPWHPNPPVARSDWVMWVGNVPSNATHDDLWSFFNQDTTAREPVAPTVSGRNLLPSAPAEQDTAVGGSNTDHSYGVSSVFLISRSNCAFVNYEEEEYLNRAVSFFNGRPLYPKDPRCPRLVCRVRRKDDDLRAGVGGQRGMGMHARWVQDQERRMSETATPGTGAEKDKDTVADDPATSPSTYLGATSSSGSSPSIPAPVDDVHKLPADLLGRPHAGDPKDYSAVHSGSGSTNSSFLSRNFPKRYFILKSLTQGDLITSVQRDLWATQPHNESTLDRAYRTSKDVYLIFSANKSGEWFGYARMEGPVIDSQQSVSWESRGPSKSPTSPTVPRKSDVAAGTPNDAVEARLSTNKVPFFSPSEHKFAASPGPITSGSAFSAFVRADGQTSAPPEMGQAHKPLTNTNDGVKSGDNASSLGVISPHQDTFELDQNAPYRAARTSGAFRSLKEQESHTDAAGVVHRDAALTDELERARGISDDPSLHPIREMLSPDGEDKVESWGKPFKIRWIKTDKLPFHRTRHLRNPWNSDREVKVSRDGTEVEPSVGQRLLDEWDRVVEPAEIPTTAGPASTPRNLPARPGAQSTFGSTPVPPTGRGQSGRAR